MRTGSPEAEALMRLRWLWSKLGAFLPDCFVLAQFPLHLLPEHQALSETWILMGRKPPAFEDPLGERDLLAPPPDSLTLSILWMCDVSAE